MYRHLVAFRRNVIKMQKIVRAAEKVQEVPTFPYPRPLDPPGFLPNETQFALSLSIDYLCVPCSLPPFLQSRANVYLEQH